MSSRNVIITAALTSVLTTICVYFGLDYLKSYKRSQPGPSKTVEVPLILGLPHAQADNVIRQAGLKLQVLERRPDSNYPKNAICVQMPVRGTKLPRGSVVTAVLSDGQPKIAVPQVVGSPLDQAKTRLEQAGFKVGRVTSAPHPTVPKDMVIACTPLPGTQHKSGTAIQLIVSTGSQDAEVPKVYGQFYKNAKKKIIEAGFVVGSVRWRDDDDHDEYIVLSQSPKPGTKALKGSKVDIVVNRGD